MNAISPAETRDRSPAGTELLTAVEAWRPDPECIRAGDEYLCLALRCYSSVLSDLQIRRHLERYAAALADDPPDIIGPRDAAFAIAAHSAIVAASPQLAGKILARLSVELPGWEPTDPDDIAALVRATYREIG
jgi:hypothetical protein